jgi:hypothetical protein
MIYTAPCVIVLMQADTLRGEVGSGKPFGAQKTRGGGGRWGVGGGEVMGPSSRGRKGWRGFNLCVRVMGGALAVQ